MRAAGHVALIAMVSLLALSALPAGLGAEDRPTPLGIATRPGTLDDRFSQVAARVPGFGGLYVDGDVLKVYLKDPSQTLAVKVAITAVFGAEILPRGGIQVFPGTYGMADLLRWHAAAGSLFNLKGVLVTDLDEKANRVFVGVLDEATAVRVFKELPRLGIPRAAVIIEQTEPVAPAATLRDRIRPIEGGLQIAYSGWICTLGFNGVRSGVDGFVTNSHCTDKQGGVESTKHYQPSVASGNFIGTEIADPQYTKAKCPSGTKGKVCRWSDSAYSQRDGAVTADQGFIARPTATGSITIAGTWRIVSEGSSLVGQTLNKVGRTTGWSQGAVSNTCQNLAVLGSNILLRCQDRVSASVGSGDSGSPVFAITNSPQQYDVQLRGILWGSGGGKFAYSPIGNIEMTEELGPIDTCASGFSC